MLYIRYSKMLQNKLILLKINFVYKNMIPMKSILNFHNEKCKVFIETIKIINIK